MMNGKLLPIFIVLMLVLAGGYLYHQHSKEEKGFGVKLMVTYEDGSTSTIYPSHFLFDVFKGDKPVSKITYKLYGKASLVSGDVDKVYIDLSEFKVDWTPMYNNQILNEYKQTLKPTRTIITLPVDGRSHEIFSQTIDVTKYKPSSSTSEDWVILINHKYPIKFSLDKVNWKTFTFDDLLQLTVNVRKPNMAPQIVLFDVSKSGKTVTVKFKVDDDSEKVTYLLEWDDGKKSSGEVYTNSLKTLTHTYSSYKTYYIKLKITDPDGKQTLAQRSVTLSKSSSGGGGGGSYNSPPTIYWLSHKIEDKTIWLTIKVTDDKSSKIDIKIDWGDKKYLRKTLNNGQTFRTVHVYYMASKYTIKVTATDSEGKSSSLSRTFEIGCEELPKVYIKAVGEAD